jgi:HAD superfamily hydrolase (TIGR01509 family)
MALRALLWDVDGTLAETEHHGHRLAFNRAFAEAGVPLHWDGARYGALLRISGGHERLAFALAELQGSAPDPALVAELQARKQTHYASLLASGELGLAQAFVTTSARQAVAALAEHLLGSLSDCFSVWVCGEDVVRKKPDCQAYRRALQLLGLTADQALALEDSAHGLDAAAGAGLACLVTLSHYGQSEPLERFARARAVVSELGPEVSVLRGPSCHAGQVTLSYLQDLLEAAPL